MPAAAQELGSVFITGASAGIGAATARLLASEGYTVYAAVHTGAGALAGLPGVRQVPADVTDPGSVAAAARQVAAQAGDRGLHAVINNAGIIVQGPLELVPPADLLHQFQVNTLGPAYVVQAFLPLLRAGHGRVINISAPTARLPVPFMAPISASKAALASLADALRLELAAWGIPVSVVEPGGTDTQIFAKAQAAADAGLAAAGPAGPRCTPGSWPRPAGPPPGSGSARWSRSPGPCSPPSGPGGPGAGTRRAPTPGCSGSWPTCPPASVTG